MCVISAAAASLAVSVIGAGVSAYSQYQSGKAQARQADYQSDLAARNAQQAQYQADYERDVAKNDAAQHRRQVGQTLGGQRSLLAASGVDISDSDSSAMSILGDTAQWGEHDAQKIQHQGELKALNYENQASQEKTSSLMYRQGTKQASQGGAIGAGMSLLSGAGRVAGQWYNYGK